ncbi:neutral zinc metallopeptidase [Planobispora takensis]|nr:neutral zinc metallopeptidase [Planobispora takensis]
MRIRTIIALTGVAGLLLTGTAHAYPIKDKELTKNALYESGEIAETECEEPPINDGDLTLARKYWAGIQDCLNTAWETHLTQAGLPFSEPTLKFGKIPRKFCGYTIAKESSMMYHCPASNTIVVQIGKDWVRQTDTLWEFYVIAQMYGYHVQDLVGVEKAYQKVPYANKNEMNEQIRRNFLQTSCLSGVFMRSVWPSLDRSDKDWKELQSMLKRSGDVKGEPRVYGKGSTMAYWTTRGYTTGDPASCNTWAAPASKVA